MAKVVKKAVTKTAKKAAKKVAKKEVKKVAKKVAKTPVKKVTKKATATKKVTTAKKVVAKKSVAKKPALPKALLTTWLKGRDGWNDLDWWQLLEYLRAEGHSFYADVQEGREAVSAFLKEKSTSSVKLPKRLLNAWLKGRTSWNHDDWLGLLKELEEAGHKKLVHSSKSLLAIGHYLESNVG